jgi:hypothetical protein
MAWWSKLKTKPKPDDQPAKPRWLAADQTPFGIEVLDCRPLTQTMLAVTGSFDIATNFTTSRQADGRDYVGKEPADARVIECRLRYPFSGSKPPAGPLFKAAEMEDKWDLYVYDDTLYCVRSWTGDLLYSARARFGDGEFGLEEMRFAGNAGELPQYSVRALDFLIKSHVYNLGVPHPLVDASTRDPEQLAVMSFSVFGRRAWFGAFEETVGLAAVERVLWGRTSN